MAEETMSEEEPAPAEKRKRSGPGFFLGLVIGSITGAAAATLFAPTEREETRGRVDQEAPPGLRPAEAGPGPLSPEAPPVERIRAMLDRVRSRVQEATEEGRRAAREAEAEGRARYAELTHREPEH